MESAIDQLKKQFQDIFPESVESNRFTAYMVFHYFGKYCALHFENDQAQLVLNTISRIYREKHLFTCNAIENEFLSVLAKELDAKDLTGHLKKIPESLWEVYIKVFIETQKNNL